MISNPLAQVPNLPLQAKGHISSKCLEAGFNELASVCAHVRDLPYGELQSKQNWENTLDEKRGTSSTKHAFLKALMSEMGLEVDLVLGIYSMTDQNTPGVGPVLAKHRMQSIPEAHCYLRHKGMRLDFTRNFFDNDFMEPILSFIHEELIEHDNAPSYKRDLHLRIIQDRFGKDRVDHIWQIREQCIAALEN